MKNTDRERGSTFVLCPVVRVQTVKALKQYYYYNANAYERALFSSENNSQRGV